MDSIKQLQVAKIIQQNLSQVFQLKGPEIYGRAFVTLSGVRITPDLGVARAYVSVYNVTDKEEVIDAINKNSYLIKKHLYQRIRNKMRRMPEMEFYLDGSLDEVDKMDNLFKGITTDKSEEEE